MSDDQLKDIKLEKLKLLEEKARVIRGLPHLYGFKDYKWSREFLDSDDRTVLLTAANQLGKSTSQIRKIVEYATNVQAWPSRFRRQPRQFWYLYPTAQVATAEFHTKWKPDILPKEDFKDDPQYGWKAEFKNRGDISAIYFNSGVALYFKTYAQDVQHLQSGTVDYVACFPAGTKIKTEGSQVNIETVKVGDYVETHLGFRKVVKVMVSEKEVITRKFSDGSLVSATRNHPFYTHNRGWVPFCELTPSDECIKNEAWHYKNTSNLSSLKESFTRDYRNLGIPDHKIISGVAKANFFTLLFGKAITTEQFQRVTSFITRISFLLITRLGILNCLLEKSTQESINYTNGNKKNHTLKFAKNAGYNSLVGAVKNLCVSVAGNVVNRLGLSSLLARGVGKISPQEKILTKCFVLNDVVIKQPGTTNVYNIEVEDAHTYFADNFLVHNCDEELPLELWDEINFRRNAVDGYFSMVFTATLGQEFWRLAMEPKTGEKETMPFATKLRASLFDCQHFLDGTPSHWTLDKIHRTIAMCKSEAEVQRRVYGRFVKDEGLKYPSFDRSQNVKDPMEIPAHWPIYVGVDIGAGGDENHPSAITFVAVKPDYRYGRVFRHWRGDDKVYTMSDVANKYLELSQDLSVTASFYDYHAKDFKTITDRMGLSFISAEKRHDVGEQVINVLFKNSMLDIDNTIECGPIINELASLQLGVDKRRAKDDSVDSMRYALTKIPFDFSHVGFVPLKENFVAAKQLSPHEAAYIERNRDRLRMVASPRNDGFNDINEEIKQWNEIIGSEIAGHEDFF